MVQIKQFFYDLKTVCIIYKKNLDSRYLFLVNFFSFLLVSDSFVLVFDVTVSVSIVTFIFYFVDPLLGSGVVGFRENVFGFFVFLMLLLLRPASELHQVPIEHIIVCETASENILINFQWGICWYETLFI